MVNRREVQKVLSGCLIIVQALIWVGCEDDPQPSIAFDDYKVAVYYVIPADEAPNPFSIANINLYSRRMQSWYQAATGGVSFEYSIDDSEEVLRTYHALRNKEDYQADWWNLLLGEMIDTGLPVNQKGTVVIIWVEGVDFLDDGVKGFGQDLCEGNCGAAMIAIKGLFAPGRQDDIIIPIHELGHAFGLVHPVEIIDGDSNSPIFSSVMTPYLFLAIADLGRLGLLTGEKEKLYNSPFLKKDLQIPLSLTRHSVLNYPVTDSVPNPRYGIEISGMQVQIADSTQGVAHYFWEFGDGANSSERNPVHTYEEPGRYFIRLRATSPGFMVAQNFRVVEVEP